MQITATDQPRQIQITDFALAQQCQAQRRIAIAAVCEPQINTHQRLDACRQRGLVELDQRKQIGLVRQRHGRHAGLGHSAHQFGHAHDTIEQ